MVVDSDEFLTSQQQIVTHDNDDDDLVKKKQSQIVSSSYLEEEKKEEVLTPLSQNLIEQEQENQDSLSNDQNRDNHLAATDAVENINDDLIALPQTSEQDEDVISPIAAINLSPLRKTSA